MQILLLSFLALDFHRYHFLTRLKAKFKPSLRVKFEVNVYQSGVNTNVYVLLPKTPKNQQQTSWRTVNETPGTFSSQLHTTFAPTIGSLACTSEMNRTEKWLSWKISCKGFLFDERPSFVHSRFFAWIDKNSITDSFAVSLSRVVEDCFCCCYYIAQNNFSSDDATHCYSFILFFNSLQKRSLDFRSEETVAIETHWGQGLELTTWRVTVLKVVLKEGWAFIWAHRVKS